MSYRHPHKRNRARAVQHRPQRRERTFRAPRYGAFEDACPATGKIGYLNRQVAKENARRIHPNEVLRPYRCDECGYWHVGHNPADVIAGAPRMDRLVETLCRVLDTEQQRQFWIRWRHGDDRARRELEELVYAAAERTDVAS